MKKALFLTGGGARGAYQAGVLKAIADITLTEKMPVPILSGVSTGAINAAFIAARANHFATATYQLVDLWTNISCQDIYQVSNYSLIKAAMRSLTDILFHVNPKEGHYFLDSSPLRSLLDKSIDFRKINHHIENNILEALEIATLCYDNSDSISYYNTKQPVSGKQKFRYQSVLTELQLSHVMASTAIPLFFPSVQINGMHHGDGSLRNNHPLRSSINLGADSIMIIGVKEPKPDSSDLNLYKKHGVSFARIMSMIYNSMFLDNIERDIELLEYINQNVESLNTFEQEKIKFKKINYLYIRPSVDFNHLAQVKIKSLPTILRYLMNAFGSKEQSSDMISYLLFDEQYCKSLIQIGYQDGMAHKDDIMSFLSENEEVRPVQNLRDLG